MTGANGSNRRPPRLNHKKSRAGCQRCKARRVKCDETKPSCGGCTRHDVPCVYSQAQIHVVENAPSSDITSPLKIKSDCVPDPVPISTINHDKLSDDSLDLAESRERRLFELRLWHNYVTIVATPFHPGASAPPLVEIWNNHIPYIALQHENLLNAVYAISATHLLRSYPNDAELLEAQRTYLSLALREQRNSVVRLEQQAEDADSVCFASILMTMNAFGSLQERSRHPYKPPIDMLRLGMGALAVFDEAMKSARTLPSSKIVAFVELQQFSKEIPRLFDPEHRTPFLSILGHKDAQGEYEDRELWDEEARLAYEHTLSYIGTMYTAVQNAEPLQPLCVRIASFNLYVPAKFVDMLEELRPRALVVLAHFFALATKGSAHWWVGLTPMRELQGLRRIVPPDWQRHMRWPLVTSGLEPV